MNIVLIIWIITLVFSLLDVFVWYSRGHSLIGTIFALLAIIALYGVSLAGGLL